MKQKTTYADILLHIPHSSIVFPQESGHDFSTLTPDELLLVDFYTDQLFAPSSPSRHITPMVFPYCRLYCDVERLINDPLEQSGLGISYRRPRPFGTLRQAFPLYADFHAAVSKQLVRLAHTPLLIDCHSFSALPNLLNPCPPDIDICIGFNDDHTRPCSDVISATARHFRSCGYKVGINTPFSNSKTFDVPVPYHTLMIEVNKRLYIDEHTLRKTEGFKQLQHHIRALYTQLLNSL